MRVIICLCICLPFFLCAQGKQINSKVSIRGYVGIPKITSSSMFRAAFNGIVETGISANLRVFDNFHVGGGYQFNNFLNNKKEWSATFTSTAGTTYYTTQVAAHSGFIKLGYDNFWSNIGYMSYSLNTGFMSASYLNVRIDSSSANLPAVTKRFSAPYLQPELGINFIAEKALSFSILLSYTTLFYKFDPKAPKLNHIGQINGKSNRYVTSWINIGIGFNILIDPK